MTKRRGIVVGIAGVALGAIVLFMLPTREPIYEGKPVSAWLEDLSEWDDKTRDKAQSVLSTAGPEVIPLLVRALTRRNSTVSQAYSAVREKMPMFVMGWMPYPTDQSIYRNNSANVLAEFGPVAKSAVPQLWKLLKDDDEMVRCAAAYALGSIGPDAREAITDLLKLTNSTDAHTRVFAGWALWRMDPTGQTATATRLLTGALTAERVPAQNATDFLEEMGQVEIAVSPLVEELKSPFPHKRTKAAALLGRIGPDAAAAVRPLTEALKDQDIGVRLSVARALGRIGPAARSALPRLLETRPREPGMFSNTYAKAMKWNAVSGFTTQKVVMDYIGVPSHARIDQALKRQQPVIAKVFISGVIPHWVLIVGKDGDDYQMRDPLDETRSVKRLSEYKSKIYAMRTLKWGE